MAPQITRPGTPGAHRAVAEVAIHQGAQVGVGAPDVVMAMTEGMHLSSLFLSQYNNFPVRGEVGQNPGNNLHVSGLSTRVDTRDLEAAFAKIGRVSVIFCCVATR
jgi:hypothetical protein